MERIEKKQSTMAAIRAAFPVTIPVLTGYLCLGMGFGLLMESKGYGPLWSMVTSMVVLGGSIQYLGVTLLSTAYDPFQALLLSILIDARHMFYGLSLLDKFRGTGRARPFLIFGLTDETYSLLSTLDAPEGVSEKDFCFWVTFLDWLYWVIGSTLGGVIGTLVTFDTTGLDFVLTALFVVLFMEQWKKKEHRPAGVIGILCTIVSLVIFGADNLVIPAMVLILAALLGGRKKLCV